MRSNRNRRIALLATIVLIGCIVVSVTWAATGQPELSLREVVTRLLGLEKRVTALEARVKALEQKLAKPLPKPGKKPIIEITSPKNDEQVNVNVYVEGVIWIDEIGELFPLVVVHPLQSNLFWVQQLPSDVEKVPGGFKFRCRVFCGTIEEGKGEKFELFALLAKRGAFVQGDQLQQLPKDVPASPSVVVTRE
jgi:hypothetical protein